MKQCWKSNTENTQLTDSETAGGNKGKHLKTQQGKKDWDTEKSAVIAAETAISGEKLHHEGCNKALKVQKNQLKNTLNC